LACPSGLGRPLRGQLPPPAAFGSFGSAHRLRSLLSIVTDVDIPAAVAPEMLSNPVAAHLGYGAARVGCVGGAVRRSGVLAAVAVLICTALSGCTPSAAEDSVVTKAADTGTLVIGTRFTQPGLSERTLDGRFVGFDIDVGRFVAAELGVDPEDRKS